jgi:hypothetical protein
MELVRKQQREYGMDRAPEIGHAPGVTGNLVTQIEEQHSIPTPGAGADRIADRGIEQDLGHSLGL